MARIPLLALIVLLAVPGAAPAGAAQEMPDPRQMSGVPLPVPDVEPGTVTVRVIRGTFANPVVSQTVELTGGASPLRATTNEAGRAEFTGLRPGTRVKASAVVAGARLESQEFVVPPTGGIRMVLVAGDPEGPVPSTPGGQPTSAAVPGQVVLGEESRFIFEMGEDGLSVFYVLQILNRSASAVQPERPLVFELPAEARRAGLLEGAPPQATVAGRLLQVPGPFPPGPTVVQVGYNMPLNGPELVIEQQLPVPLAHVALVAQKVGDMQLASPQMAEQRTMPAQGNLYIAGRGGSVAAGDVMRFHFTKLPHEAAWPRNLALALAVLLLVAGAWASLRPGYVPGRDETRRLQLEGRRDQLFEELTALERQYRARAIEPDPYAERRRELVAALERVYTALDDEAALGRAS